MTDATRQALIDSKPKLENFSSEEEFLEATDYWISHVGRILALTKPARAQPMSDPVQTDPEMAEQQVMADAVARWFAS